MKRAMWVAAALWLVGSATEGPIDQIYTSTNDKALNGKIVSMTATAINLDRKDTAVDIPTNEIVRIVFEGSPEGLTSAQRNMLHGEYDKAIEALKKETGEDKRAEVVDEIAFCRAYCTAQLALSGTADPAEAGKMLLAFINGSPNSFHYLNACELLGDVFVTLGKFGDAQTYYAKLSQAPWPDYKIRAQVALGRSYLAQDNAAAADKAFDEAIGVDATGDLAEVQRTAARIGKARCMVLTGKTEQALHDLNEILERPKEKSPEINAMAYNALGAALRRANRPKEAILAYLHVHLLYSLLPDLDAEAVANLEKLFIETHKEAHARNMREILDEKYHNSRWAKGVK